MGYDKRALCEQIEKLRAEGKTFTAIAQAVHASRQTVQRIAATFGIQKRKWARVKMLTPVVAQDHNTGLNIGGAVPPKET